MPRRTPEDAHGRIIDIEVPPFESAIRHLPPSVTEMSSFDGVVMTCPCNVQVTLPSMVHFGADGRLTNPTGDPRFVDLALDHTFAACPRCGRVFHIDSLVAAGDGGRAPVLARMLPTHGYTRARADVMHARGQALSHPGVELNVWESTKVSSAAAVLSRVGATMKAHELASIAARAHDVNGLLTRLPDLPGGSPHYNVRMTSANCPDGVNVAFTPAQDAGIEDLDVADLLTLFARNDEGIPGRTLLSLVGALDAGFLALDHAPGSV